MKLQDLGGDASHQMEVEHIDLKSAVLLSITQTVSVFKVLHGHL